MSATPISALPPGPLDPERAELLMRIVDGLEPLPEPLPIGGPEQITLF